MLRPTLNSDFELLGGFLEIVRLRPFLDFQLKERVHFEIASAFSGTIDGNNDSAGYSIGLEIGIFVGGEKLSVGIRPSLLYYKRDQPILTTSLLIIKIPMKRR